MEDLISKKELLAVYGISYGALYRWKRMGLIPEEWFLRKSTFTGQETYFPRALVCPRIETILAEKDSSRLEELAARLCGRQKEKRLRISTRFGDKEFSAADITGIVLLNGDGTEQNLNFILDGKDKNPS